MTALSTLITPERWQKPTLAVGSGARAVATNSTLGQFYVVNENSGTVQLSQLNKAPRMQNAAQRTRAAICMRGYTDSLSQGF